MGQDAPVVRRDRPGDQRAIPVVRRRAPALVAALLALVASPQRTAAASVPPRADVPGGATLDVVPIPLRVARADSWIRFDGSVEAVQTTVRDARVDRAITRLRSRLAAAFPAGARPPASARARPLQVRIDVRASGSPRPRLGDDEAYRLVVGSDRVTIEAGEPTGALRALSTLLQLVAVAPDGYRLARAEVQDRPRFAWRGLLIDPARRFLPVPDVLRVLDAMEVVKLNVLHWHLTDDQGFRMESRRFPLLHGRGSDGLFYTQEEIREVIAAARDRGIRVVPELDVPGHVTAWLVGHPEIAAEAGPYIIERKWGIFDPALDPTREETYTFLDALFGEVSGLFDDEFVHVGGDEVNGRAWTRSESVRAARERLGLGSTADLQAYFSRRLAGILEGHARRVVAWDEVLHADVDRAVVIQSYRWHRKLVEAARRGHRSLLSSGYYLDMMFSSGRHYAVDPQGGEAEALGPDEGRSILGGEACLWGEFVSPEILDARLWPRAAAVAERLWSPREAADESDLYRRLESLGRWLEASGSGHVSGRAALIRSVAGPAAEGPMRALADLVEPVKEYARLEAGPYTSATPLRRLVDLAIADSVAARRLGEEVDALLEAGPGSPERVERSRSLLRTFASWRSVEEVLRREGTGKLELEEAAIAARRLAALGELGAAALERLEGSFAAAELGAWRRASAERLASLERPVVEVTFPVAAPVRRLLDAVGTR